MSFKSDIDDGFLKAIEAVNARRDRLPKDQTIISKFNWFMWSARERLDRRDYQQAYNKLVDADALLPKMGTYSILLFIEGDDLNDEFVDKIYEAGFDDGTLCRSGGQNKLYIHEREGESWIDVAMKASRQLEDAGFTVTGAKWDREKS